MKPDFDRIIDRKNTRSMKWDGMEPYFGENNLVPLWVADMDFKSPPPVIEALSRRAEHGVYGYAGSYNAYFEAVRGWMQNRFGWNLEQEWISPAPGVIPALILLINALSMPGDRVVVQPPVYPPFFAAVNNCGRHLVYNPLIEEQGCYRIDFEDLELKLAWERVRLLILCSPHNPVGRVWTKDELEQVVSIASRHGVFVIADEIHADLVFGQARHTPLAMISDQAAQNCAVLTAASKTFNLAGLQTSNTIIKNEKIRNLYWTASKNSGFARPNIFGLEALIAAYNEGESWLEELLVYLSGNYALLQNYLAEKMPSLKAASPEGTYLAWVDCRAILSRKGNPARFFQDEAGLAFNDGSDYGPGGAGFIRINFACPRPLLEQALESMAAALDNLE